MHLLTTSTISLPLDDLAKFKGHAFLQALLSKLGLTISKTKLILPSTKVIYLGIEIDTVSRTIANPDQKLQSINEMCVN